MKKILIILFALFLTTGCSVAIIDTNDIDSTVDTILLSEKNIYNRIGKGYKYYKPRGVSYVNTIDLNDILYSDGNYYYLYIDVVSYYYQEEISYEIDEDAYYSKTIDGDRSGYIEVTEKDDKYLVEYVYNYAKIEALVEEEDINKVILDASYILSTVEFNDNIIVLMLDDDYTNKEEQYTKYKSQSTSDNFLQYEDDEEIEN